MSHIVSGESTSSSTKRNPRESEKRDSNALGGRTHPRTIIFFGFRAKPRASFFLSSICAFFGNTNKIIILSYERKRKLSFIFMVAYTATMHSQCTCLNFFNVLSRIRKTVFRRNYVHIFYDSRLYVRKNIFDIRIKN